MTAVTAVPATVALDARGRLTVSGDLLGKKVVVMLEFPSMERARAWYASPEYAPLIALRERTANTRLVFADGVA